MLSNIYLCKYNNYFNRQLKLFNNIESNMESVLYTFSRVNFNPNDGITTTQIVNYNGPIPDYLVECDLSNRVNSRWFVVESTRLLTGQFKLSLKRDVLADYYTDLRNSICFIEKSILNENNTLIFNKENMNFNQVKKNQWLIKDETQSAWIVGYIASNTNPTSRTFSVPVSETTLVSTTGGWEFFKYSNLAGDDREVLIIPENIDYQLYAKRQYSGAECFAFSFNKTGPTESEFTNGSGVGNYDDSSSQTGYTLNLEASAVNLYNFPAWLGTSLPDTIDTVAKQQFANQFYPGTINSLDKLNNQTILFSDTNEAYRITLEVLDQESLHLDVPVDSAVFRALKETYNTANTNYNLSGNGLYGEATTGSFSVEFAGPSYRLYLEPIDLKRVSVEFPEASVIPDLEDAPYSMFAIPYGSISVEKVDGTRETTKADLALKIAQRIAIEGGNWLLDIQLLPYSPVNNKFSGGVYLDGTEGIDYINIKDSDDNYVSTMFFPKKATFGTIMNNSNSTILTDTARAVVNNNVKIQNETDLWRLNSPNDNGIYEFSRAKNNNTLGGIIISCTYRPFSPYIKLCPLYQGKMYTTVFGKDTRGLICGGDFSLPRVNDAWVEYELQNKNYEKTFQRQIEHLDTMNNIQRGQDITNAILGTVSGATSGGMLGSVMAPGSGNATGLGAAVGGLASAVGGVADIIINEQIRQENKRLQQDMYTYNLQNIQARPQSLAKVSAFTADNKIFPYLEYYTCTDREREALINKIKYNGMTTMTIGTFESYINKESEFLVDGRCYIQGHIIKCDTITDDYGVLAEISEELKRGVFA